VVVAAEIGCAALRSEDLLKASSPMMSRSRPCEMGRSVGDIQTGWKHALSLAEELARSKGVALDLSDVTPHRLKHTAISWVLQNGVPIWPAAGSFSTSPEARASVYGHHWADRFREVLDALDRRS
jgi:integrase